MNDLGPDPETQLRDRLAAARQEHADLDVAVQAISAMPTPSLGTLGRLKRRKLALKDEIAALEDQLTPDIIA
ncbi:DUF465 domain-containing protein [Phenylobacterium sp.]|uniref:YdcH family protein n=1 Tax=Phenylobacterium sp. TaxID=1871053 RepID=UPI00261EC9D1|nr:DUF465 domain-containing protein [Phenylobacterium sp.]